jgi:hypothetical protein
MYYMFSFCGIYNLILTLKRSYNKRIFQINKSTPIQ